MPPDVLNTSTTALLETTDAYFKDNSQQKSASWLYCVTETQ